MGVDFSWISNVDVNIKTSVVQAPSLNTCLVVGIFPTTATVGGSAFGRSRVYSDYATVLSDFSALMSVNNTALENDRYAWLIGAAYNIFSQSPAPQNIIIGCMEPSEVTANNYTTAMTAITAASPSYYAFTFADKLNLANITQISGAITALRSLGNKCVLFINSRDPAIVQASPSSSDASLIAAANNNYIMLFYHQNNTPDGVGGGGTDSPTPPTVLVTNFTHINLSAATMGMFFIAPEGASISSRALQNLAVDTSINTSNINYVTVNTSDGSGKYANCYPSFGTGTSNSSGIGLLQYGTMSASNSTSIRYLDQIFTADYADIYIQSAVANVLLTQNVYYDDNGIQLLLTAVKKVLQGMVNLNMLQPFENSQVTAVKYADYVKLPNGPADIANRIYKGITANVVFLTHIQKVNLTVNISLV